MDTQDEKKLQEFDQEVDYVVRKSRRKLSDGQPKALADVSAIAEKKTLDLNSEIEKSELTQSESDSTNSNDDSGVEVGKNEQIYCQTGGKTGYIPWAFIFMKYKK